MIYTHKLNVAKRRHRLRVLNVSLPDSSAAMCSLKLPNLSTVSFRLWRLTLIARLMGPKWAHLGPTGPRWAPFWPHELCYLGSDHPVLFTCRRCQTVCLVSVNPPAFYE